ncbi:MAG: polysulfide reductase [Chloroflexi bacterium]|nr:polysulfide reductase [Chloroflexota bacterium]MDL1883170.1 polysulfide reductase [Anaerolineae bacterium CFX8]
MTKRIVYVLGILAVVVGTYGFYSRLFVGEREVNYGSYVTWGLWVAMYLFFAGVASGSMMVATLDYLFEIPLFKGTGKYALWGAMVTLPAALISIGMDLGHMERIWKVYLRPNLNSLLAQMVWGYTLLGVVILVALWLVVRSSGGKPTRVFKLVMVIGLVMAIFVSGGVGALLGVNASRMVWHVGLLPAQFPIFSLATGVALLLTILALFTSNNDPHRSQQMRVLGIATILLLVVKTYILWADFSMSLYSGVPQNVDAINQVLYGPYWWSFWIVQIVLGTIIPIIVLVVPSLARNRLLVGLIGILVLVGFAAARANIVFPALSVPELEGLATAFSGPHLNFDYFPSLMEWSVTIGVVGLATLAYLLGIDRLPFLKDTTEVAR